MGIEVSNPPFSTGSGGAEDRAGGAVADLFDLAGGVTVTNGTPGPWTDITWDTDRVVDSVYSRPSSAVIAMGASGLYSVFYRLTITVNIVDDNSRQIFQGRVVIDSGGGFAEISGTRARNYNRQVATVGAGLTETFSFHGFLSMSQNDELKVQARMLNADGDDDPGVTIAEESCLTIHRIR